VRRFNQEIGAVHAALEAGAICSRLSWAINSEYIFRQVPTKINMSIVSKMVSLPEIVRDEIINSGNPPNYVNQIAYVHDNGDISSYSFSHEDFFGTDWVIVTKEK